MAQFCRDQKGMIIARSNRLWRHTLEIKTVPDVQPTRFSLFYFVLFYFFPAHFSLHRLLIIWTAGKGYSGMIAWIYHNVKLFAKKGLDMYPPTRVLYV